MTKKTINLFNPNRGDVYYADFGDSNDVITKGVHPCVFLKKIGNIAYVIPITSFKGTVHWSQKLLRIGEANLPKQSILKTDEPRTIGIDKIHRKKLGKLDFHKVRELLSFIKDVILN